MSKKYSKGYSNKDRLKRLLTLKDNRAEKGSVSKQTEFLCPICTFWFKDEPSWKKHWNEKHNSEAHIKAAHGTSNHAHFIGARRRR